MSYLERDKMKLTSRQIFGCVGLTIIAAFQLWLIWAIIDAIPTYNQGDEFLKSGPIIVAFLSFWVGVIVSKLISILKPSR